MDNVIHQSRTLPCSVTQAFACFTQNALLTRWLTADANVSAEVGGAYELFWQPDDRENNSTIGCKITALCENQLLAFEWKSPVQFKAFANQADPLTHVVVSFVEHASGCKIHLVHSGWRSSENWLSAYQWQQNAWHMGLDNLVKLIEKSQ